MSFEVEATEGERYVWLSRSVVDQLRSLRGPGESYSDVIVWLVAAFGGMEA